MAFFNLINFNFTSMDPEKKELENKPAGGGQLVSQEIVDKMRDTSLSFFNPALWQGINTMATTFYNSGALPKALDSIPKVIMALQAGKEVGMQPLEALSCFAPINGKMTMYGNACISQVAKAGHLITWGECNEKTASVTITRGDNGEKMTETYTIEDAKAAGHLSKPGDVWNKYPRRMLKYKAFAEVSNFLVPDALHGVQIAEIIEGEIIDEMPNKRILIPKNKKDFNNITPGAMIPGEEVSLEAAINKPDEVEKKEEKKPVVKAEVKTEEKKVEKKTLLENVLETCGGEVLGDKPLNNVKKTPLETLRETANNLKK